jgi:large subunit ribosomal protein L25
MSVRKNVVSVEERQSKGGGFCRAQRRGGKIPAIVYSRGVDPKMLLLNSREWETLSKVSVNLVDLKKASGDVTKALVKEVQKDFLTGKTIHIDFQAVRMDEVITASIPIHTPAGVIPPGVTAGGVLDQPLHEIEVSCLPGDMPDHIEADISKLNMDDALYVRDLVMPAKVTAVTDPDAIVFHVIRPAAEEAKAAEGEEAPTAPEVITEKKEEPGEGDAKEGAKDSKDSKEKEKK